MNAGSLIALVSVIIVGIGIWIPARQAIRRDRREEERYRSEQTQREVDRAVAPLLHTIEERNRTIRDKDRLLEERQDRINQFLDERRH